MKKHAWCIAPCLALLFATSGHAAVTFNFNFEDFNQHNGIGFDDAANGALRRQTLTQFINSTVGAAISQTATIDIEVNTSLTSGVGLLANAASFVFATPNSFQPGLVQQHIMTGLDFFAGPDAVMTWNFGYSWAINTDPVGGQVDFRSVALHEITHALGFISFISSTGASVFGSNIYSAFDSFLVDGKGNELIDPATHAFQSSAKALTSGVYFAGADAAAVYGGLAPLYTPPVFAQGSSLSHWAEIPGLSTQLMSTSFAFGEINRSWSPLEIATLKDLGYSMAVPEPATGPAIFVGAGVLAVVVFRRRRRIARLNA